MPTYDDGSTPTLVTEKPPAIAVRTANTGANGSGLAEELAHTVDTTGPEGVATPAVVLKVRGGASTYMKPDGSIGTAGKGALTSEEVTFTVAATQDQTMFEPTETGYVVRRLTPIECERLQGFPDRWTDLTGCDADAVAEKVAASLLYDEKKSAALLRKVRKWSQECPDGPRYKACGNSFAVPNVRWLFDRIQAYATMRETPVR